VLDVLDWRFDDDCKLQLGAPIAVGADVRLAGLGSAHWRADPALRRRDVSGLSMAEQDIQ
jgi:hypothetical protein